MFEFDNSRSDGAIMGTCDPLVCTDQRENGDILGRRDREVVEHTSIGCFPVLTLLIESPPRRFAALRQQFASFGVKIFAETQKLIALHTAAESEHFRTLPDPLPGNMLPFAVVIAHAKVLLKVFLRIL